MPLAPFSLPDFIHGSAVPDYRLSDARAYFVLRSLVLDRFLFIQEPIGWDAAEWVIERDRDWHGLNFEFTGKEANLTFQQESAIAFLEEVYSTYGPNGEVFLEWGLTHLTGELPLQTLKLKLAKRKKTGGELTMPGERYSLHPDMRARWDTSLSITEEKALVTTPTGTSIALTPPSPAQIILHAQRIKQATEIKPTETPQDTGWQEFHNPGADVSVNGTFYRDFYLQFPLEQTRAAPEEIKEYIGSFVSVILEQPHAYGHHILKTAADGSYSFTVNVDFQVEARLQKRTVSIVPPKISNYMLRCYLVIGETRHQLGLHATGSPNDRFMGAVRMIRSFSETVEIPKNTPVSFYAHLELRPNRNDWKGTDVRLLCYSASLSISANTTAPPSTAPAYPIKDVLEHFTGILSGRENSVQSAYYSGVTDSQPVAGGGSNRLLTNGFSLRGFVGKPLQFSLQDLLVSLQAIDAIGVGYKPTPTGDVLVVEPIAYWYRDTELLSLDSYTVIEEETASEYLHPKVEIGYTKFPDEGPQVLDEFNTRHEYVLPMREGSPYTALSELIASGYALEMTRRVQFSDKPADSTRYDDDVFIICASQAGLLTPQTSSLTLQVTFQMVSGLAGMAFELSAKPDWFAIGVTFLVSGTASNDGLFKIVNYTSFANRAIAILDRQIVNEVATATLSISTSGSFQAERNESFDVVEGVLDPPTTYNLRLSPRFNFLRHARYIAGGLNYASASEAVRCTFSKNNGTLKTQLSSAANGDLNIHIRRLIQHNDDLTVAELKAPLPALWKPERIRVETKLTIDQMLYLRSCLQGTHPDNTKHYGYITLNHPTNPVEGFPLSVRFDLASGKAVLTLLKKFVSLSQLQGGQRGCSFYGAYTFAEFEAAAPGLIDNWIEQCTFDNFQ